MLLVYRDVVREARTRDRFDAVRQRIAAGDPIGALIIAGQIEQGVLDAVDVHADDWTRLHASLRAVSCTAAALARGCASARDLLAATTRALAAELPPVIASREPEGYCHYALDPLAYARAAVRYSRDGHRCSLVAGVRSIGTSLSAVVASVLDAPSITVRARGESGSRRVIASERLLRFARECVEDGGDIAIVDEGPGATGETFEVVARWCRELGASDERIVLFPSHSGSSPLAPSARREWLESLRRYPPAADQRGRVAAEAAGFDCTVSISAGTWRSHVASGKRLPATCNFERTKYLARRDRQWWHIRFAGAGEWGEDILERSRRLAERSCASPAKALKHGFVALPWVDGTPLTRGSILHDADVTTAARYLNARHRLFPTSQSVRRDEFVRVLEHHGAEAGVSAEAIATATRRITELPDREAFICDARLAPHEWIRTSSGLWKVDAVDHGDGFRRPGPTDAMWDFAGLAVEFGVPPSELRHCVTTLDSADETALEAYAPVYAALAFGDALLSAREAADPFDRRALLREARHYRKTMRNLLHRGH